MLPRTQFLTEIRNANPHLGLLLGDLFDGLDGFSNHAGFDPLGKVQPPDALSAVNVSPGSDQVHVTLTDNSQVKKNVRYFVEWSVNDPAFNNPHVEDLGSIRGRVLPLAAKDQNGVQIQYYFKAYSQYEGSDPQSKHTFFGTRYAPTAVTLSGSSQLQYLPSAGSGTGKPDGSQSGSGLGKVLQRPAPGPPRSQAPKRT